MEIGQLIRSIRENKGLTLSEVADAIPNYDAANLSRFERGLQGATEGRLVQIAAQLGLSLQELYAIAGSQAKTMPGNTNRLNISISHVPLLSWRQVSEGGAVMDGGGALEKQETIPCPARAGYKAYALQVRGISMEPKYNDGDIIFIDPDVKPAHGKNVIITRENEPEAIFRQLVVEGSVMFLRTLNPDWPGPSLVPLGASDVINGVVIGKWVPE